MDTGPVARIEECVDMTCTHTQVRLCVCVCLHSEIVLT